METAGPTFAFEWGSSAVRSRGARVAPIPGERARRTNGYYGEASSMTSKNPGPDPVAATAKAPDEVQDAPLERSVEDTEDTEPESRPRRPRRRGIWIAAAIVAVIAIAVAVSRSGKPSASAKAAGKGKAQPPIPVVVAEAKTADFPDLPLGPGHGHPARDGHGPLARGRRADPRRLQGGSARQAGRPARRDRPAAVPGPAHAGGGTAREGPGESRQRQARLRAIQEPAGRRPDPAAAVRRPGLTRRPRSRPRSRPTRGSSPPRG